MVCVPTDLYSEPSAVEGEGPPTPRWMWVFSKGFSGRCRQLPRYHGNGNKIRRRAAHCRNAGEEVYHPPRRPKPVSSGYFLVSALPVSGPTSCSSHPSPHSLYLVVHARHLLIAS